MGPIFQAAMAACLNIGFGAAKHLSEQGYQVTLLEASANPGAVVIGQLRESNLIQAVPVLR